MAQFQFADVAGSLNRGEQFAQQAKIRPLEIAAAQQQLQGQQQEQEQQGQFSALRNQGLQQQIDQRTGQQKNKSLFNGALTIGTLSDEQITPFLEQRLADAPEGASMTETENALKLAISGDFESIRNRAKNLIEVGVRQGDITAPSQPKDFTLGKGQQRFNAQGNLIASADGGTTTPEIPVVLLQDLDPVLAEKGAAVYAAAGGGKDGLTAFQKVVDTGTEQQRRQASPALLKSSFPQASTAELIQLQAAMDGAKTTESGLKAANVVRVEQRRLKKAKVFQVRAVELLDRILKNPELNDVIGSIEGSDESMIPFGGTKIRSDNEANAIADIKEAGDILVADNMSLMTGVLSETDIKILKNLSGGALDRMRSEVRFIEDVTMLRDKLSSQEVITADELQEKRTPKEPQQQAPDAALQMLKQNPEFADQFQAKFGYLPEGN